jgi:hypothetical protein
MAKLFALRTLSKIMPFIRRVSKDFKAFSLKWPIGVGVQKEGSIEMHQDRFLGVFVKETEVTRKMFYQASDTAVDSSVISTCK